MKTFTDDVMRRLPASVDASGWHYSSDGPGLAEGNYIDRLTTANNEYSVVEDVQRIRNHPPVPNDIPIYDSFFDVKTGMSRRGDTGDPCRQGEGLIAVAAPAGPSNANYGLCGVVSDQSSRISDR